MGSHLVESPYPEGSAGKNLTGLWLSSLYSITRYVPGEILTLCPPKLRVYRTLSNSAALSWFCLQSSQLFHCSASGYPSGSQTIGHGCICQHVAFILWPNGSPLHLIWNEGDACFHHHHPLSFTHSHACPFTGRCQNSEHCSKNSRLYMPIRKGDGFLRSLGILSI